MSGARHAELLRGLERVAALAADAEGLEMVELRVRGSGSRRVVRIDIDRAGPGSVTHDDCQRVSERVERTLEDEELLATSYVLEVSSPGIDRPILSADDIRRNTGRRVRVTTIEPIDGRREFQGTLLGSQNGCLLLSGDGNAALRLPLDDILQTRQEVEI